MRLTKRKLNKKKNKRVKCKENVKNETQKEFYEMFVAEPFFISSKKFVIQIFNNEVSTSNHIELLFFTSLMIIDAKCRLFHVVS
jgi:hypothetical protein